MNKTFRTIARLCLLCLTILAVLYLTTPTAQAQSHNDLPVCKGGPNTAAFVPPDLNNVKPVCRAEPTLKMKGVDKQPVPPAGSSPDTPYYHHNGAETGQFARGVSGKLNVTNPSVPHGPWPADFFAARFMSKKWISNEWKWVEAGWAEVSWRDDRQYIYIFDTKYRLWLFFDQYSLTPGTQFVVLIANGTGSNIWNVLLYWNNSWQSLYAEDLGFSGAESTEEMGEVYTPNGTHWYLPFTVFEQVQINIDNLWRTWSSDVPTLPYYSDGSNVWWVYRYYYWVVGSP